MSSFSENTSADSTRKSASGIDSARLSQRYAIKLRYGCDLGRLPLSYRQRFVQLAPDDALRDYLDRTEADRHGRAITALHRALRHVLSDFDINGLLGTYPMHVLGTEQFRFLLDGVLDAEHPTERGRLFDVGAGNGDVTAQLAPLFDEVTTSEVSGPMCRRLRRRGFACEKVDVAETGLPGAPYDLVSCLNVLDRCARPLKLLAELRSGLKPGGLLMIALVLPYSPFVYEGPLTREPYERLPLSAPDWEGSVAEFGQQVAEPLGLSVEAIARMPYLSRGDCSRPLYELDDALLLCRAQRVALQLGSSGS
jgi:SAM-dependent methyltransferase